MAHDPGMALNTAHIQRVEAAIQAIEDHFPGTASSGPESGSHGLVT